MSSQNNKFVFIIPAFNAENTITQTLMSVYAQSYNNWRIIIKDDMSTDDTVNMIAKFKNRFEIPDSKLIVCKNTVKKWEVRNILESLDLCLDNDIICRLDGDDWLCDIDALHIINHSYNATKCDVLWTKHRWEYTEQNISQPLPKNADPYTYPWVSSHFKTFRKHLINNVKDENFRNEDGQYFKRIGDQAIYLPVLKRSQGNWHFEPIVAYHYTIDMSPSTFTTDDALYQKNEAQYLRKRGYIS